jgi:cytochrome oxidase Cu insertion factor (SCO1/SenC/PrrC family)
MSTQTASARKNRIFFLLIIVLFFIPLMIAWFLVEDWRPGGTVNHGELLNPAQPVEHLQVRQADGKALEQDYLRGRWTLAYIGESCDERCEKGLYNIRQVRLALGKDMERAQTLFLMSETPTATVVEWLSREHASITAGVADAATLDFFSRAFPEGSADGWIYLIDPLGNLFMRYGTGDDPKGILDDLKRLFKYSKIG